VFRCPVCSLDFRIPKASEPWRCASGHSFDVAREGYVNLLVTHQRRRREPGDSLEMLRHRRKFLDAGHFAPLAEAVAGFAAPGQAVLDAGCGEGHYTRSWPTRHDGLELWALDIAKPAVRMAAKRAGIQERTHYAVASVYDMPVADASIDLAVSIFAPLPSVEFERVLRPAGQLVTVTPGPDHLAGLKAKLFDEPGSHPDHGPFEGDGAVTRLSPAGTTRLRYELSLDEPGAVADLLNMTPYAWYVAPEVRAEVAAQTSLSTTVDFIIASYRQGSQPAAFPRGATGHD
jgi:23S rRNA (guanine745-N1)-methyltransferase